MAGVRRLDVACHDSYNKPTMNQVHALAVALPLSMMVSCGSPTSGDQQIGRICDGSDEIRLAIVYDGQIDRQLAYSAVLHELGSWYLYVDGSCRYWLSPTWAGSSDRFASWRPIHTGVLSPDEEQSIAESVEYRKASPTIGQCPAGTMTVDSPLIRIFDGVATIRCWPDAEAIRAAQSFWFVEFPRLYDKGLAVEGPLRLEVGPIYGPQPGQTSFPWPLSSPIDGFVVEAGQHHVPGVSRVVDDPSQSVALRTLRDSYISEGEKLNLPSGGIQIEGGYTLFLRDDLPFTDQDGLFLLERNP